GKRALVLRAQRAHLAEKLSVDVARQQYLLAAIGSVNCAAVGKDGDDCLGQGGELRRVGGDLRTDGGECLCLVRGAIPARKLVAEAHQPLAYRRAHSAGARYSGLQFSSP